MADCDVVLGGIRTILNGKNIEERNPKLSRLKRFSQLIQVGRVLTPS